MRDLDRKVAGGERPHRRDDRGERERAERSRARTDRPGGKIRRVGAGEDPVRILDRAAAAEAHRDHLVLAHAGPDGHDLARRPVHALAQVR